MWHFLFCEVLNYKSLITQSQQRAVIKSSVERTRSPARRDLDGLNWTLPADLFQQY